jgi:hypothetical protein
MAACDGSRCIAHADARLLHEGEIRGAGEFNGSRLPVGSSLLHESEEQCVSWVEALKWRVSWGKWRVRVQRVWRSRE